MDNTLRRSPGHVHLPIDTTPPAMGLAAASKFRRTRLEMALRCPERRYHGSFPWCVGRLSTKSREDPNSLYLFDVNLDAHILRLASDRPCLGREVGRDAVVDSQAHDGKPGGSDAVLGRLARKEAAGFLNANQHW